MSIVLAQLAVINPGKFGNAQIFLMYLNAMHYDDTSLQTIYFHNNTNTSKKNMMIPLLARQLLVELGNTKV